MHNEALQWVAKHAVPDAGSVLDIGGRDVGGPWGGSPRELFPGCTVYHVLDIEPGDDVTIVADAATWRPRRKYEVVVCMECFEHTRVWPAICRTAYWALRPGGKFIATMAGPGRPPHGALGASTLAPGEHYMNIRPERLRAALERVGFIDILIDQQRQPADVRAVAWKRGTGDVGSVRNPGRPSPVLAGRREHP